MRPDCQGGFPFGKLTDYRVELFHPIAEMQNVGINECGNFGLVSFGTEAIEAKIDSPKPRQVRSPVRPNPQGLPVGRGDARQRTERIVVSIECCNRNELAVFVSGEFVVVFGIYDNGMRRPARGN